VRNAGPMSVATMMSLPFAHFAFRRRRIETLPAATTSRFKGYDVTARCTRRTTTDACSHPLHHIDILERVLFTTACPAPFSREDLASFFCNIDSSVVVRCLLHATLSGLWIRRCARARVHWSRTTVRRGVSP
jgi:hypothetical protein